MFWQPSIAAFIRVQNTHVVQLSEESTGGVSLQEGEKGFYKISGKESYK